MQAKTQQYEPLFQRFAAEGGLSLDARREALRALRAGLKARAELFVQAISADFGYRSRHETLLTEVVVALQAVDYTLPRLAGWAKPKRVSLGLPFWPARASLHPDPRGVVCILGPSNYPLQLILMPLIGALSAGCPTLLKPSEQTPRTAEEIARLVADYLDPRDVGVMCGGAEVAAQLTALPFGMIVFTGSGSVGAKVAQQAAPHLTPVILELGGKSPVIVDASADMPRATSRIIAGKLLNAGQTCVAPDYVLVPSKHFSGFVAALRAAALALYPDSERQDYSSLIRGHERLRALEAGLEIIPLFHVARPGCYRPALVMDPPWESAIMRQEIFGPLLPILPYDTLEGAIARVRSLPEPLALYWFGEKNASFDKVIAQTRSGHVGVNDVVMQAGLSALPFGGIGASGYGRYHGRAGFESFSHERFVFEQSRLSLTALLRPPFGARAERILSWMLEKS